MTDRKLLLSGFASIICLGLTLTIMFIIGGATRADLNGEKTVHSNCNVFEKKINSYFNGKMITTSGYELETSCGNFKTDSDIYKNIEPNQTYNLTSTVGNWANRATVVAVEISQK